MTNADPVRIGTRRGLDACASPRGIFGVLALDHRQNLRRQLRPHDPATVTFREMANFKRAVVRALAPGATGVLLDPEVGAAACIADGSLPKGVGLIVALEATGYEGGSTNRTSRILEGWSVSQTKRLGASAAKLLLYYNPAAANAAEQEELVAKVAADCRDADLALFLEPLTFSLTEGETLRGEARRRTIVETARRLTAIGGDILKVEFPYDSSVTDPGRWQDACAELDDGSAVPWVLLSGGVDGDTFLDQAKAACSAGASGVVAGRSVWSEATTLGAGRTRFLATTARDRLRRLVDVVEASGRPWHARRNRLLNAPLPKEGWYRDYGS